MTREPFKLIRIRGEIGLQVPDIIKLSLFVSGDQCVHISAVCGLHQMEAWVPGQVPANNLPGSVSAPVVYNNDLDWIKPGRVPRDKAVKRAHQSILFIVGWNYNRERKSAAVGHHQDGKLLFLMW